MSLPAAIPSAHHRRKDPDAVRRALLHATAQVVAQHGLSELTVHAVAQAAGVSKGALFHHFQNKHELLVATLQSAIGEFDAQIRQAMAADPQAHGRFTRAYIQATFDSLLHTRDEWPDFTLATLFDPAFVACWRAWMRDSLLAHPDEAHDPRLWAARCVADGYWMSAYGQPADASEQQAARTLAAEALKLCQPA